MMQIYKAVSFTRYYNAPDCNYGWIYISIGDDVTSCRIEYNTAVKLAYQLARKLDKPLIMENNSYDPMITTVEIRGFLS